MKRRISAWLPVVLMLAVIFAFSSDPHDGRQSRELLAWLLHWVHVTSPGLIAHLDRYFKKLAHMLVYALLAAAALRAFCVLRGRPIELRAAPALRALALVVVYASLDEFHQGFVPHRSGSVRDVVIDTLGGLLGMLGLTLALAVWRRCIRSPQIVVPGSVEVG